jgi:hypothetical protein
MKITQDQRATIVRKAIGERDAILAGAPIISADAALLRIRDAIAADRCDGETEYAQGINTACENHLKLIDAVIAALSSTTDRTAPKPAGNAPAGWTAETLTCASTTCGPRLAARVRRATTRTLSGCGMRRKMPRAGASGSFRRRSPAAGRMAARRRANAKATKRAPVVVPPRQRSHTVGTAGTLAVA